MLGFISLINQTYQPLWQIQFQYSAQKAIDRKQNHSIVIDERDVPVNEIYISDLKTQTGITVLAKSKWFNATYM